MRPTSHLGKLLICLLGVVLIVFMTVEVAHTHPDGAGDLNASAHCQLCATAHIAIAGKPAWLTSFVLHLIGTVIPGEPTRGSRPIVRTSFIRPPPPVEPSLA